MATVVGSAGDLWCGTRPRALWHHSLTCTHQLHGICQLQLQQSCSRTSCACAHARHAGGAGEVEWPSCTLPHAPLEVAFVALTNTKATCRPSHDIWAVGSAAYEAITQGCAVMTCAQLAACKRTKAPHPWELLRAKQAPPAADRPRRIQRRHVRCRDGRRLMRRRSVRPHCADKKNTSVLDDASPAHCGFFPQPRLVNRRRVSLSGTNGCRTLEQEGRDSGHWARWPPTSLRTAMLNAHCERSFAV